MTPAWVTKVYASAAMSTIGILIPTTQWPQLAASTVRARHSWHRASKPQ